MVPSTPYTPSRRQYESLLAQGKDKDAANLLQGTKQTAEQTLALMEQMRNRHTGSLGRPAGTCCKFQSGPARPNPDWRYSRDYSTAVPENDIAAQRTLLMRCKHKSPSREKIKALDTIEKQGAKLGEEKKRSKDADALARAQAEGFKRGQD